MKGGPLANLSPEEQAAHAAFAAQLHAAIDAGPKAMPHAPVTYPRTVAQHTGSSRAQRRARR